MHVYTFNLEAIYFQATPHRKYYILHDSIPSFAIDGYNHRLKAAGGTDSQGFDRICVRDFLTLDASTLTVNTDEDILYKMICEIVSKSTSNWSLQLVEQVQNVLVFAIVMLTGDVS